MKNSLRRSHLEFLLPVFVIAFLPTLAHAHPGVPGHAHGLATGLVHPLTGLDHLLAMVAVGIWAAQRGGRALWTVPLTFVSVMALGAALSSAGISIPLMEQGIAASVLVLGILIATSVRLPVAIGAALIGCFALFHGFAHGAEMPASASGLAYGLGFVASTALLHLAGITVGLSAKQFDSSRLMRCAGVAIAVCGLVICFT